MRERWHLLQGHLGQARTLADAGDAAAALAAVERALEIDPEFLAARSLQEELRERGESSALRSPEPVGENPAGEPEANAAPPLSAIEAKVLARRAQHRLATAAEALRRRNWNAAAAALDEAREIGADPHEVQRLERDLVEATRKRPLVTSRRVLIAATLVVGVLAADYLGERRSPSTSETMPIAGSGAGIAPPGGGGDIARPTTRQEIIALKPAERAIVVPEPHTAPSPTPPSPARAPAPASAPAAPQVALGSGVAPLGPVASVAPPVTPPVTPPARSPGVGAATASILPSPSIAPLPPRRAPAARPDDAGVRATLEEYRKAYEQLNASSARAVWPAVDERALARAFEALSSQQLKFDACDVNVHDVAATATCRGTASYTPKFGRGELQVEPRNWFFTLRKDDGRWAIETARVERY